MPCSTCLDDFSRDSRSRRAKAESNKANKMTGGNRREERMRQSSFYRLVTPYPIKRQIE
jgi:hypothetical protein